MQDSLTRLVRARTTHGGLTPFVGSGVAVAATSNAKVASWIGLIEDGIAQCQRALPNLRPEWAERLRDHLVQGDVISYLAVAQEITARLRGHAGGRVFARWLVDSVGSLKATDPRLPRAIASVAGGLILTTNYDTIIEAESNHRTVNWCDQDASQALRNRDRAVVHLHGVASQPDSVIMGAADYQRLADEGWATFLKQAAGVTTTFMFVGCGAGLSDPSIGPLLRFLDDLPDKSIEHYLLVPGVKLRTALREPAAACIQPVAYGPTHGDLPAFLEALANGSIPYASQDSDSYDGASARPVVALLDIAGPAENSLKQAIEDGRRVMRAVGQLERRITAPAGMLGWDLSDQQAVHQQIAASAAASSDWVKEASEKLVVGVQTAADTSSKLLARQFADRLERLRPLLVLIEELRTICDDVAPRLEAYLADLRGRAEDVYDYVAPIVQLEDAATNLHEAAETMGRLGAAFDQSTRKQLA